MQQIISLQIQIKNKIEKAPWNEIMMQTLFICKSAY